MHGVVNAIFVAKCSHVSRVDLHSFAVSTVQRQHSNMYTLPQPALTTRLRRFLERIPLKPGAVWLVSVRMRPALCDGGVLPSRDP